MSQARRGGDRLVRTYVVTSGRSRASRNHFNHITLSDSAAHLSRAQLNPEHTAILEKLAHSAQLVAELSALLHLPVSVLCILLADLMESGHIHHHAAAHHRCCRSHPLAAGGCPCRPSQTLNPRRYSAGTSAPRRSWSPGTSAQERRPSCTACRRSRRSAPKR
ncbi:DUF742 domain-containing protein [Streptomyces mirabilis]|uniref:DUF742 domain-containing protein n=1 Tax=Streptomyces mirabilis TaxID=68239 RepID=UPI00380058E9